MKHNSQLLKIILRNHFKSFIAKTFSTVNPDTSYHSNWHIDLIADYLEDVRHGKIKRLIINMPPRSLKSICVSVALPAWLLGHKPSTRIMAASYSGMLSIKHSLDCRLVLDSSWYQNLFPKTLLSKNHNQKNKFLTTKNGFRFATSVGGSATGEGGDILIIDDPHNPTEINSVKLRSRAIEWFKQTFATRLNDKNKGAIILVMQRLHEHDLSADLLANSDNWQLLKIPAKAPNSITYSNTYKKYIYQQGQLLNSQYDREEFLQQLEREIGYANFVAQYQQEPISTSYNLLSLADISYYETLPTNFEYYIQSWDTAIKISEQANYSVCTCWGILQNKFYLVDMIHKKLSYPDLKNEVQKQAAKYIPRHLLIEDKASGQSIIQDLRLAGYGNIEPIKPKMDKITRFASIVPMFQAGIALLPRRAPFKQILINELTTFPHSSNDDIVDSVSQMLGFAKQLTFKRKVGIRML